MNRLTAAKFIYVAAFFTLVFSWSSVTAAHISVDTMEDSGPGSLRHCLQSAANGDTICFEGHLSGAIALKRPLPIINHNLTIIGNGQIILDGQHQHQVLFIDAGTVIIRNLTIKNGYASGGHGGNSFSGNGGGGLGAGGALFVNNDAIVILTDVNFKYNLAKGGDGGCMDNIYSYGAGAGGGGGMNGGNGGEGSFNFGTGSGGGGGGGLNCHGGSGFAAGGGGGGLTGVIGEVLVFGNGGNASLHCGGTGGNGIGGHCTGGRGGFNNSPDIDGHVGNPFRGGGGGGGGASTIGLIAGNGGCAGAIGGGGGGGGGDIGGAGGNGGDFGGGGGGGGSLSPCIMATDAPGGTGGFGGGGGGGGGCGHNIDFGGSGGAGGFGGGGGAGGKNAPGGFGGHGGGAGGANGGGGGGGAGYGGAIFVRESGVLVLKNVTFCCNKAVGGSGCQGGKNGEAAGFDIYFLESAGCKKRGEVIMTGNGIIKKPLAPCQGNISIQKLEGRMKMEGLAAADLLIIDEMVIGEVE